MVYRKLEIEFSSKSLQKINNLPYATRFFVVQALNFFAGTSQELREKHYRFDHDAFEIGIGDVGRLLVDVDEEEGVVRILDFRFF